MHHAKPADLAPLEPLLGELRRRDGLVERKPGNFARGSQAFLHFHVDGDAFFCDVKLDGDWVRFPTRLAGERKALLRRVDATLAAQRGRAPR